MSDTAKPPIIVIGMPRSGTTLVRRLLDGHPNIACPGETFLMRAAARFLESQPISFGIDYGVLGGLGALGFEADDVTARLRALVSGFYDEIAQREGKERWAAKTAVDSFYLADIERVYGGHARFLCVVRHGLDVVCSLADFAAELEGYVTELHRYVQRFPRPDEAFAHAWADVTREVLAFCERHPDDAHLLRYEDLVERPEDTLRAVMAFLDEPWSPRQIRATFRKTDVSGLGDWKTYEKTAIDTESVGRWRGLSDAAVQRLAPIVNPVLAACDYAPVQEAEALTSDAAMRKYELAMMFKTARSRPDDG